MTPEGCSLHSHTRALHHNCEAVFELNFIELFKRLGIAQARELIARTISEKKIDVFFISLYGDNFLLSPEFLRTLRHKVKIVLWCFDDDVHFDSHSKYYAPAVDAVVTTDFFSWEAYKRLGVPAVLCLGNFDKKSYPASALTRDIDVSFVGNCSKTDRRQYMDFLVDNGINVDRFGFGSSSGFVSDADMAQIFNRSKINLNFSRLEFIPWIHGKPGPGRRTMGHKGRPIEVAMTRSFCLSEAYPALPHVFNIGSEIDCFTDRDSLLAKVRHYLSHEDERERIAEQAHIRALRDYENAPSFSRVLSELAAAFAAAPPSSPALDDAPEFTSKRVNDLCVHALSLLLNGRFRACVEVVPELFQHGPWAFLIGASGGLMRGLDILYRKPR